MSEEKLISDYLGDGVYFVQEQYGFWLRANDHRVGMATDEIFIEPEVFDALIRVALRAGYVIKTP